MAQEAANDDTKSTAGDKHETGRAMMHLEREKGEMQLIEAEKLKSFLDRVDISKTYQTVQTGSLVLMTPTMTMRSASCSSEAISPA